jgi:hypothetical protein
MLLGEKYFRDDESFLTPVLQVLCKRCILAASCHAKKRNCASTIKQYFEMK